MSYRFRQWLADVPIISLAVLRLCPSDQGGSVVHAEWRWKRCSRLGRPRVICFCGNPHRHDVAHRSHECLPIDPRFGVVQVVTAADTGPKQRAATAPDWAPVLEAIRRRRSEDVELAADFLVVVLESLFECGYRIVAEVGT